MRNWRKIFKIGQKISSCFAFSKLKRKSLDLWSYGFMQSIKNKSKLSLLNKLPMFISSSLLFLEKSGFQSKLSLKKLNLFYRRIKLYHSKLNYIGGMKALTILSPKYFPEVNSGRFVKKLFGYRGQKFFGSKLNKINYYFMKAFIYSTKKHVNKGHVYYLARDAYFSKLFFGNCNVFRFGQNVLNSFTVLTNVIGGNLGKFKFFKFSGKFKSFKSGLSIKLSKSFTKALVSTHVIHGVLKMRKKFFTVSVQTDSFIKLHKREFYVPFQSLFFKKSILRFTNTKYFLLPAKQLMLENTDEIAGWLLHKLGVYGVFGNFISLGTSLKNVVSLGYDFFNATRLEKIITPVVQYFRFFKKSFLLPIAINYIDILFLKGRFLPPKVIRALNLLLLQLLDVVTPDIYESEETEHDKLLTLFFYKFVSEVFELVFSFSPGNILFFKSKGWKQLFNTGHMHLTLTGGNWEYLKYYSGGYALLGRKQGNILPVLTLNYDDFPSQYYEFYFFVGKKKYRIIKANLKVQARKGNVFDLRHYFSKVFFPITFMGVQLIWRFFYMGPQLKLAWFGTLLKYGGIKLIYDAYMLFQNRFWNRLYLRKTSFERLLLYGFAFGTGVLDFSLDWNFLVGYKGTLAFKLKKKKIVKIGKKRLMRQTIKGGFLGEMGYNPLFSTFFTFLSGTLMLGYYLQFGHIKANYNTSYKDHLIMIYNDRFILNILNIQLNIKGNLRVIFKMFYLAGFVCLVAPFNILLEGLIGIYGAYGEQPFTGFVWINGLFSNFDKIFGSIQTIIANSYASRVHFSGKSARKLIGLWFSMGGVLQNLTIDISFFPSLYRSSWVFLEACARFYPTITTSNTECFLPTAYLEYTAVSNDFSLLSLCLYVNLMIAMFRRSKLNRQVEFSVYPQKLLSMALGGKGLPFTFNVKYYRLLGHMGGVTNYLKYSKGAIFDFSKTDLSYVYKYYFIFGGTALQFAGKQNFWRFLLFKPRKALFKKFF